MKIKIYFYFKSITTVLVVLLFFQIQISAKEKKFELRNGFQWYPFIEWNIKNPSSEGTPFDVKAKVIFTHVKAGESLITDMFYDKDNTWKFRFSAGIPGEWSFRTISDKEDLNNWTGKINITENRDKNAHGFMKSFGNRWGWEGTEEAFVPQYVMGKNLRAYIQEDEAINMSMIERDIEEFINGHGFSGFHFPVAGDWFKGKHPDPSVYAVLETIITKVHQLGGGCHIWLWGSNIDALNGEPMNEKDKRNLRYLAARLGPLPGWSMGYGFDVENGWASRKQLKEWKEFLEGHMGWKHFLGARVGYDEKGLFAANPRPPRPPHDEKFRAPIGDEYTTWLGGDYTGYTSYRPLYDRYRKAVNHRPDKPSFEEDRFRLRDSENWKYKDYNEELTRRGLWHSAMAGGVANIWGNLLPEEDKGGSKPYKIKEQIKTYSLFFENRFLKEYKSKRNEGLFILFTPDNENILIYSEAKDLINFQNLNIPVKGPIIAVDAKSPYKEIIVSIKEDHKTWKAPYKSDWAVAVGDFK